MRRRHIKLYNCNIRFLILIFFIANSFICCAQNYTYRAVPDSYSSISLAEVNERRFYLEELMDPFYIEELLPHDFVIDGSVDYTKLIQKAFDSYRNVIMPNYPVLVNSSGLTVKSESRIYFQPNSKILLQANSKTHYEIIRIHNVKDVEIYFPVIEGDRDHHFGSNGEWGFGISIKSSEDINIVKARVINCWGDGIYLGRSGSLQNKNINLIKPFLDNNRRNGISIISAINLKIESPVISNTYGISPMAGIDIEPNSNIDIINSVLIDKPITYNNGYHGMLIALSNQSGKLKRNVSISINGHIDDHSNYGLSFKLKQDSEAEFSPSGIINIIDPIWKNSRIKPVLSYPGNNLNSIDINVMNPQAFKLNGIISLDAIKEEIRKGSKKINIR